jgi:hypothetical protein
MWNWFAKKAGSYRTEMSLKSRSPALVGCVLLGLAWLPAGLSAEDILVDSLSDPMHWKLVPDRIPGSQLGQSTLKAVTQPTRPGASGALELRYDLQNCHGINLEWLGGALLGRPTEVSFWLYGDRQKHHLTARLEDATGHSFLVPLGDIDWQEWRQVEIPMEESKWEPMRDTPIFLRNVPAAIQAFLPAEATPRTVKVLRGESGQFEVTLRNPFHGPVELSAAGQQVRLPAGGTKTVTVPVPADQTAIWQPLVWLSPGGQVAVSTPVNVTLLAGQRPPILEHTPEINRLVEIPDSSSLNVTDEVTIAFTLRVNGPPVGRQAPRQSGG